MERFISALILIIVVFGLLYYLEPKGGEEVRREPEPPQPDPAAEAENFRRYAAIERMKREEMAAKQREILARPTGRAARREPGEC